MEWDLSHHACNINSCNIILYIPNILYSQCYTKKMQVFHSFMMPDEFYRIYKRLGSIKYWILSWFAWILKIFLLNFLGPMKVGFHTTFGDGTEIPDPVNTHVHDIIWKNLVFNRWKKGDVVMIDNFRVSHGRQVELIM